jgi:predicted SAM-dependent methyltransferase
MPERKLWDGAATRRLRGAVTRSRTWLRGRDVMLRVGSRDIRVAREDLARRYLFGEGIEIGPMAMPTRLPPGVTVRYVDRLDRDGLLEVEGPFMHPEHNPALIPEIDVVDEADRLANFADDSVDFIIANHVLEHLEDPIEGLEQMLRITRPGGVLLLTLPHARHTFDDRRPRTTVEHVVRDHEEGPQVSRRDHYEEWARFLEDWPGEDEVQRRIEEFAAEDARHHFHVWELEGFLQLLVTVELPCEIVHAQSHLHEFAVVLRAR